MRPEGLLAVSQRCLAVLWRKISINQMHTHLGVGLDVGSQ